MDVQYVQHWGDDLIVCNAARVSFHKHSACVDSENERHRVSALETKTSRDRQQVKDYLVFNKQAETYGWHEGKGIIKVLGFDDWKLINYLAKHKHTSCFEHMGATLKLKVPIFIARQIQRHRTFSYNEVSRRYVDSPPEFFWPDKWRKRADNVKQGSSDEEVDVMQGLATDSYLPVQQAMEEQLKAAVNTYNDALTAGIAPELARMILPQNMYTEFYMSGNLRAWAHFLALRLDGHAQKEVQDVAKMVQDILDPLFPVSMKALMDNP